MCPFLPLPSCHRLPSTDLNLIPAFQGLQFSAVQFSRSVVCGSFQPHGLQYTRPPCPSQTPGVHSNSCALSWWCHPTISSFVILFFSCLQSFLASVQFISVLSHVQLFATPWTAARQTSLSITDSQSCSNLCPSIRWCHPGISFSAVPFSCFQSFPTSGSLLMSWLFASGGQVLEFQLQHHSFQWIFRTDFF